MSTSSAVRAAALPARLSSALPDVLAPTVRTLPLVATAAGIAAAVAATLLRAVRDPARP